MEDPAWEQELERRIRIYEQMEAAGSWPGRLTTVDYLAMAALLAWRLPRGNSLGAANRVTLARGVPVCLLAAALVAPSWLGSHAHWLVGSAALALAGDGLDGWVARRTGTESAFGARFDMELDAFLILVLSLCVIAAGKAGAWVLAIGGMRYLLVAAMRPWPWLAAPLPESLRRKAVCVWQVASLLGALSPWVPVRVAGMLLALSLALLAWSFALDVRWLQRAARAAGPAGRARNSSNTHGSGS